MVLSKYLRRSELLMNCLDIKLPASDGNEYSLKDFEGKKFVLFFYPKDSTPG